MWIDIFLIGMGGFNVGSRFERICNSLLGEEKVSGWDLFHFFFGFFSIIWGTIMLVMNR